VGHDLFYDYYSPAWSSDDRKEESGVSAFFVSDDEKVKKQGLKNPALFLCPIHRG
jgi:hypothetical protein